LAIKDIGTARRVVAELRTKLELNGEQPSTCVDGSSAAFTVRALAGS